MSNADNLAKARAARSANAAARRAAQEPDGAGFYSHALHVPAQERPAAGHAAPSVDTELTGGPAVDPSESLNEQIARIRKTRKPLGAFSQKLALDARPGYHRHWFNDSAGRVAEAIENGWAHVQDRDGKPLRRCVGSGRDKGALYAYAMEIPEVFWLEDMEAKHQAAAEKVDSIRKNPVQAKPGQSKPSDGGKFYSPVEGAEMLSVQKV